MYAFAEILGAIFWVLVCWSPFLLVVLVFCPPLPGWHWCDFWVSWSPPLQYFCGGYMAVLFHTQPCFFMWPLGTHLIHILHISPKILVFICSTRKRLLSISHNIMMYQFPLLDTMGNVPVWLVLYVLTYTKIYISFICGEFIMCTSHCSSSFSMSIIPCHCSIVCPFCITTISWKYFDTSFVVSIHHVA